MLMTWGNIDKVRKKRRGFWIVKKCVICNSEIEIRQHPNKKENRRKTCSPKCSNLWLYFIAQVQKRTYRSSCTFQFTRRLSTSKLMQRIRKHEQDRTWRRNQRKKEKITKSFLAHHNTSNYL